MESVESMAVIGMFIAWVIFTMVWPANIEELRDYHERFYK